MLLNILKRIIKGNPSNNIIKLVKANNLTVGKNTILNNANINILHQENNCQNITIGKDCNIEGNIYIYSSNAKIIIGDRVYIGAGTQIICYDEILIENDVMISWDCTVIDTNSHSLLSAERINDVLSWNKGFIHKDWSNVESKKIHIKKSSWISFKSIILKGLIVGEGAIVAAGSVVTKNIDNYCIVGGNPAKFIKKTT